MRARHVDRPFIVAGRGVGLAVLAFAVALACSPTTHQAGGLELIIVAEGLSAPADFDRVELQISQQLEAGAFWDKDYLIPSQELEALPATFAIAAGDSPDQQALIRVTAFRGATPGATPVVQREAQVQVPTDRVAELLLVLAKVCAGQVETVGAEGEVESTCPPGQSCQPDTGMCGSSTIDPSMLPTYNPGDVDSASGAPSGPEGGEETSAVPGADAPQEVTNESDAPLDVSVDVAVDQAVDAPADAFDGCIATGPEICTNGIDDNCDGTIDCADPACSGYTCAAEVPSGGWIGPVLLWTGASTATMPACPTGYTTALDAHEGPTGVGDTCSCTCAPSGQTCSVPATISRDLACATTCLAVQVPSGCTSLPANTCGIGGSLTGGAVPAPAGGNCTPQVTTTMGSAVGWTTSARLCAWVGPDDSPGGCNPSTGQCVLSSPGTANGFAATPCVYQSGDVACPAAYPSNKTVLFSGESDLRACTGCTCGGPSGGMCTGNITLFAGDNCTGNMDTYALGSACLSYGNQSPTMPTSIQGNYTVTPGTCTVITQAQPMGGVIGTATTTVCCM